MKRYYILAGTHEQARLLASESKLNRSAWEYVRSEESIMGLRGGTLLCYGTWKSRKDLPEIMARAKVAEMNIVYVDT